MYGIAPFVADIDAKNVRPRSPPARPKHSTLRPRRAQGGTESQRRHICLPAISSVRRALSILRPACWPKAAKVVVTGLIGGAYSTAVAMFPLKAMTIEGTTTGTLAEARELIDLVRAKKIAPPPMAERQLNQAHDPR